MEIVSIHVPKTAGVTFRNVLLHVYGVAAVNFDYGDRALDPEGTFQRNPAAWAEETRRRVARLSPEVRVIHGHFGGAKYDPFFAGAKKLIWLRDPVSRLISHYHYWRDLPPTPHPVHRQLLAENLTLLQFARMEPMRNIISRIFLRDCDLDSFAFVGIQEHFTTDLTRLARLLGWPTPLSNGEENRNPDASYQTDHPDRVEIAALNAKDIQIFGEALARRPTAVD